MPTSSILRTKRINRAMLYASSCAFALLYCVQPLLPALAAHFMLTPAQSSWALSISTLGLALALFASGPLSERIGRKRLMVAALAGTALFALLTTFAQNFTQLVILRGLLGVCMGALPAVAMAYLGDEVPSTSLGHAIGIYIGGSAFGGMVGRIASALISDYLSWQLAMAAMGVAGLYGAWAFWRLLPEALTPTGAASGWAELGQGARTHLRDAGLPWLFAFGFLVMGVFVSLYNYISYRLVGPEFGLGQSAVGALSVLYLTGLYSAVWAGRLADRIARRNVLWFVLLSMLAGLMLTLSSSLYIIVAGMTVFTFGFFASHSVASSWVGLRARAPQALASALYLFFYYLGSSAIGSLCGLVWSAAGWGGVVALLAATLCAALGIALRLRTLVPLDAAVPKSTIGPHLPVMMVDRS